MYERVKEERGRERERVCSQRLIQLCDLTGGFIPAVRDVISLCRERREEEERGGRQERERERRVIKLQTCLCTKDHMQINYRLFES